MLGLAEVKWIERDTSCLHYSEGGYALQRSILDHMRACCRKPYERNEARKTRAMDPKHGICT